MTMAVRQSTRHLTDTLAANTQPKGSTMTDEPTTESTDEPLFSPETEATVLATMKEIEEAVKALDPEPTTESTDEPLFSPETEATVLATMKEIEEAVKALDPERRNLLANAVIGKVEGMLDGVLEGIAEGKGEPEDFLRPLALAQAAVGLASLVTTVNREEQEDWTRTEDQKVNRVWTMFADMVRDMASGGIKGAVITPDDLPIDLLRRVATGNGTPEDHAEVKRVLAEKTGTDPDEIDVAAMVGVENGKIVTPSASAGGKPEFKNRLNDRGIAVDDTGHEYGGQYL